MKRWEELGNERWKLSILPDDPEDPAPPSVYRGTKDEIAEMLADSQANANRRISELKRNGNGVVAPPRPGPLTPGERLQTVAELNDPATVDQAITRVVESAMGETMEQRRARDQREEEERLERVGEETALRFAAETPEYYSSQHNAETMFNYMITHRLDMTKQESYTTAFEKLTAAQLLQPKPQAQPDYEPGEENVRERNAPVAVHAPKAPSRVSTGVMGRDISGLPPRPSTRLKYTREQIDDMSAGDYKRLMQADPELGRCVEYYAAQDRQPKRRAV